MADKDRGFNDRTGAWIEYSAMLERLRREPAVLIVQHLHNTKRACLIHPDTQHWHEQDPLEPIRWMVSAALWAAWSLEGNASVDTQEFQMLLEELERACEHLGIDLDTEKFNSPEDLDAKLQQDLDELMDDLGMNDDDA